MAGGNFYTDNEDLMFHVGQMVDWKPIVELREDIRGPDCPYASVEEAVETYLAALKESIGELAAQRIAPRAEGIDKEGCKLEGGVVHLPEGMRENLKDLTELGFMGMTLPFRYGGLNFPTTVFTAATEILSRADASLMNLFGLQAIAETINLFAGEEIKGKYVPALVSGGLSGAMVLTEAESGSDLLSVQTQASLDETTGTWRVTGAKRFITNGCGDVLLVLARSEDPNKFAGGRGLSLFLVEKSDAVEVRKVEHKLGLHGSPTCELYFENAPGLLIGQRGKGLTRYVSSLVNSARIAVAAQALGISEAAFQSARRYADERAQFGKKIREFPAVAQLLADMKIGVEAARSLLYLTSQVVDMELALTEKLKEMSESEPAFKETKKQLAEYAKLAEVLTPMVKYHTAELSIKVASDAIQVHGGYGYMKEYPVERLFRDARITSIYEGTSQIQVDAALPRILKGNLEGIWERFSRQQYQEDELAAMLAQVTEAQDQLAQAIAFVKAKQVDGQPDTDYRLLSARALVDMAIDVLVGYLFLSQAQKSARKRLVARKFVNDMRLRTETRAKSIQQGNRTVLENFEALVYGEG